MKIYLKCYNGLLLLVMIILNIFSGCKKDDNNSNINAEYGAPYATYIIDGRVRSEQSPFNLIENIEVKMNGAIGYTNENGEYQIETTSDSSTNTFTLSFRDIDGPQYGEFINKDTIADYSNIQLTGGDGNWNAGTAAQTIDISLKPKK